MKSFLITVAAVVLFVSCAQTQANKLKIPVGSKKPAANEAVATFAEGCFWHAEIVFQSLVGVRDAVSGYAGGTDTNPTYESVASGSTGHTETVNVYYDPTKISYETLVAAFFASMDPTTLNRQGNDAGTEYRSAAFYRNEKEKQILQAAINRINASKKYSAKVVTELVPFTKFYPAEDYHQEYILNHPDNSYVQHVSIPDFTKFRNEFKGPFKQ
ncbi:MAG: peptide-methionine (S)-S-oxide reductase MsrA [Ferruginibacter sp.]